MKSNLAHEPPIPQGQVVHFPKNERKSMLKKDDGFTPLPNFICDEGYLAVLSGDAIKCIVLLNRHIKGFHLEQKALGEVLVMKITGIKDKRTVRKCMADLAKLQLISITKTMGKNSSYTLTLDDRISIEAVTSNVTTSHVGTSNVVTSHVTTPVTSNATTPVTSNVTTTSDIKCHSVKEIDLKENIKKNFKEENSPEHSVDEVLNLWTPDLHSLNSWLQRSGEMAMTQDLVNQVLLEVNAYYEPRLKAGLITETLMYSNFVKWVKRGYKPKAQTKPNLNVNDAWNNIPEFQGDVTPVEIPEDFV
ncbi:replication protein [Acinetobacter terrestris]|uniref:Replication protein n=1 Tax=Acinetobacter terrestris TaxID=2529843 RepID=A0ABX1UR02_9GAMM|nr:replication protein [Acinetobacter terrestris]NNH25647.1 replication protein [Acinetobacter terrestris]TCB48411.1 replication protein [Acinetobacter terrestris]